MKSLIVKTFFIFTILFCSTVEAKPQKMGKQTDSFKGGNMTKQYKEGISKRLTSTEKIFLLNALHQAIRVLNEEVALSENDSSLGRYHHIEPKSGKLKRKYYITDLTALNFSRPSEESPWNYVTLGILRDNFTINDFIQKDFDFLGLQFDQLLQGTYKATKTPSGERLGGLADLPCYKYQFRLKTNPKIRVIFRVFPEMMNKNESFPRNFDMVTIYKDD